MMEEERDEWLDEEQPSEYAADSLFNKKKVVFSNKMVESNIDLLMELSQPYSNSQTAPDLDDPNSQPSEAPTQLQALYNPLEEDELEGWMRKEKGLRSGSRVLTCPHCMGEVAYGGYSTQESGRAVWVCGEAHGVVVQESKVIRRTDIGEEMKWGGASGREAEKQLRRREEEMNVKLVVECECGVPIGYFDVNKMAYVLTDAL